MALLEHTLGPTTSTPAAAPTLAAGVELLGAMPGSGYRRPPCLVRRADGQTLQLTPTLHALLELVDGRRDHAELADALSERIGKRAEADQVRDLLEHKVRPLGLLRGADGSEPATKRSNPLLALRCRYVVTDPERTGRIVAPFTALFRPVVATAVIVAFVAISGWLVFDHGLAQAARHVLYEPALLLTVFALTVVSAAFHELGHAAACRYGGATPGAMGAGLYLVFPAFYTDVSDSYRLPRRDRLRVDLGGLHFNAAFAVGAFLAWAVTGSEALLVLIPLQQLQMLKQLAPFIRLDGYHVLADLTGVPDLFARIKPVLLAAVPGRRDRSRARELKPWVRAVVTAWVLLVVPVLAVTFLLMVVTFPRLVATVWDSAGRQWDDLAGRWGDGDAVRTILGGISLVALVVPLFSVTYFLSRILRRSVGRVWRGTDGNPPLRFAAVMAALGLVALVTASWWPGDRYQPIRTDERGTVADLAVPLVSLDATPAAATSPAPVTDAAAAPASATDPALVVVEYDPSSLPPDLPPLPRYDFQLPDAPGEGDNQALALNRTDGTVVNVSSGSLVWVFDGVVDEVNEAWALTNCRGCATQAVAFQVILVVGDAEVVSPQNRAVAVNGNCVDCVANAIAQQLVLTLDAVPSDEDLAALAEVWAEVEEALAALGTVPIEETLARLDALEAEIVEVLGPSLAAARPSTTTTVATATTATTVVAEAEAEDDAPAAPSTTTRPTEAPDATASTTTTTDPPSTTATTTASTVSSGGG